MAYFFRSCLMLAIVVFGSSLSSAGEESPTTAKQKTLNVLFIGNSFTARHNLSQVVKVARHRELSESLNTTAFKLIWNEQTGMLRVAPAHETQQTADRVRRPPRTESQCYLSVEICSCRPDRSGSRSGFASEAPNGPLSGASLFYATPTQQDEDQPEGESMPQSTLTFRTEQLTAFH